MLLTSYLKLAVADPNNAQLKTSIEEVFDRYSRSPPTCAQILVRSEPAFSHRIQSLVHGKIKPSRACSAAVLGLAEA